MTQMSRGDRITVSGVVQRVEGKGAVIVFDGAGPIHDNYVYWDALSKAQITKRKISVGDRVRHKDPQNPANLYDVLAIDGDDAFVRYLRNGEHFCIKDYVRKLEVA